MLVLGGSVGFDLLCRVLVSMASAPRGAKAQAAVRSASAQQQLPLQVECLEFRTRAFWAAWLAFSSRSIRAALSRPVGPGQGPERVQSVVVCSWASYGKGNSGKIPKEYTSHRSLPKFPRD